jgi:hypothetical protein
VTESGLCRERRALALAADARRRAAQQHAAASAAAQQKLEAARTSSGGGAASDGGAELAQLRDELAAAQRRADDLQQELSAQQFKLEVGSASSGDVAQLKGQVRGF